MKVLWIVNVVFPEVRQILLGDNSFKTSGGWMVSAAEVLAKQPGINLAIVTASDKVQNIERVHGKEIDYYLFPIKKSSIRKYENYLKTINDSFCPDIVHIHGTEFPYGFAFINACGSKNVIVSIQGLISACYSYYHYGMTNSDIIKNITIRDILRGTIFTDKRKFKLRGEVELKIIKKIQHVIGRTEWDKARVWAINPKVNYHCCNETLRDVFYNTSVWDYSNCSPHSIFISQANYPIKGFHQLLKAMPLVLSRYPDTIIRVAGGDITNSGVLRISGYGKYIKRLIDSNKLEKNIIFLGPLDADKMKQEYLRSNVFVCASSIENSSNSIGEAQLLGVPVIASFVGGNPSMMKGDESNLFRFEEIDELANKICKIFSLEGRIDTQKMRIKALERHNTENNLKELLRIYSLLLS